MIKWYIELMHEGAFVNIGSIATITNIVFFVMILIIIAFIWYLVWTFVFR
jgi:hypothetical protein